MRMFFGLLFLLVISKAFQGSVCVGGLQTALLSMSQLPFPPNLLLMPVGSPPAKFLASEKRNSPSSAGEKR